MKDDSNEILNDLLASWHRWARGYSFAAGVGSSPMFRECRSNHRQWASLDEVADEDKSQCEAVDAVIMSLCDVYRTALQIQARNLCTGRSVWTSARLPADEQMRAHILADARTALTVNLRNAGVL
jgi:hypothetical protein